VCTYKIRNTTQPPYLYDLVPIQPPHGHNTRSSPYVTLIKQSKSLTAPSYMLRLIFGISFLLHSEYLIRIIHPLSATFIWTFRFNLLHTAITFHHFFAVSLWAQNLLFQKILSSTLVYFCLSDWSHGSRLFIGLICLFYVLVLLLSVFVIPSAAD